MNWDHCCIWFVRFSSSPVVEPQETCEQKPSPYPSTKTTNDDEKAG